VRARQTAELGELVAAAFDEAARYSNDPQEVSRLATYAITHLLRLSRGLGSHARKRIQEYGAGDQQHGVNVIRCALEAPLRQMVRSRGAERAVVDAPWPGQHGNAGVS
jgi:hypothetical protein